MLKNKCYKCSDLIGLKCGLRWWVDLVDESKKMAVTGLKDLVAA